jgi:predicted transposase YdaD
MDTDKLAYEIFAVDPGSFFEILGQPRSEAKHYVFHAVDLKAVERRVDGYFEPKDASRPLYFSEILFYKKENAYANVFAKLFLKLEQVPTHPWRVAMLFESRSLEPADLSAYTPLLTSGWVHRIYLDEVQETSQSGVGLCILKLASTPKSKTVDKTKQLAERVTDEVRSNRDREKFLALIEYIVTSKFPDLSREEIGAMLNLGDYKKSRAYKETWEEAREERDAEWIKKLSEQGISAETIAQTMGLDLDAVKKILKKKPKRKS